MSWFLLDRNLKLLEPYDWKLSRTVLRGERGSNAPDLPGKAIASANMADYIRYLYKTVRKYFGEAIVVTQEVEDIISSPIVKESIINNSDCKILLDRFFVKFGGNLFFISTVFFFLNPIKSCRYVCFLVTLKTPHH